MNLFSFIKEKIVITDVVSQYTNLKRAGNYLKGFCPFHSEKTGSFTVSPDRGIFYCFGCHEGGDVITFISKVENCSAIEAARHLADQYQIEIPESVSNQISDSSEQEKKTYYNICELITNWCQRNLFASNQALDYVTSRAINKDSIKAFNIGYWPSGQAAIKNLIKIAQDNNFMVQDLIDANLLIASKGTVYSPFEERIIFPIRDHLGRFCAFGGRVFKPKDERAKYYNSHEHRYFNKSELLFGLNLAKKAIKEKDVAFMCEGYLDVISMVQHGYPNTIATLGTSCTQQHLKLLSRYTQRLYVVFDGDPAGQKAIMRLVPLCWDSSIDLYVVSLSKEEDPASYLSKNNNLNNQIESAQDIFTFSVNYLSKDFDKKNLHERIDISKKFIDIISNIKDKLKRDLLLSKASNIFKIPFETLRGQLDQNNFNKTINKNAQEEKKLGDPEFQIVSENSIDKISLLEKKIFSAILSYGHAINSEEYNLLKESLPVPLKDLLNKVERLKIKESLDNNAKVFDMLEQTEKNIISRLLIEFEFVASRESFDQLMNQFYKKQWKILIHNVKLEIDEAQKTENNELVNSLLLKLDNLKKKIIQRGVS